MIAAQPVEQQDFVQPVEEFRPEAGAHDLHHLPARGVDRLARRQRGEEFAAQIGGHDDQDVAEIDRPALAVGQPAVVEHLEQDVEHVRVGFLDLVEQQDAVGPPAHRLGQRAALVVADIARRGADQAGDGVLLHIFRHVDAHHRVLVVEQEFGQRAGQLRLADAGRPEEQEAADRPVRVLQAGAGAAHGVGDGADRLVLADDPGPDRRFHLEQLLALAFEHLVDRDAGPARDDGGDDLGADLLVEHPALGRVAVAQPAFQFRDAAVFDLGRPGEIAGPLGLLQLDSGLIERFLELLGIGDFLLLGLPDRGQVGAFLLEPVQFAGQLAEPLARAVVALFLQRLLLDLELDDPAVEFVDLVGLGIDLHAQPRRGLVHQVDRLVGQEAVGDVAAGQGGGRDQRRIGDAHAVVQLVFLLQAAQDGDGVLHRRLADEDRLEAPGQRGVLLDMLAVFVQRRGADAVQRAAGERRLEHV